MISSLNPSLLLAFAALPGAGAKVSLQPLFCQNADEISLYMNYQCNGAVANGAPTLTIRWQFNQPAWDPTNGTPEGTIISAGTLVVEDWPFATPGAAGAQWTRLVVIKVPPGATELIAQLRETGTPATPGSASVMAAAGRL